MTNMTGQGKYEKGLELERGGKNASEIALVLGYKSTQAWYSTKTYYASKAKALTGRAAAKQDQPEPAPILEGLPERVAVPQKASGMGGITVAVDLRKAVADAIAPVVEKAGELVNIPKSVVPGKRLTVRREISAEGELMNYRFADGKLHFRLRGDSKSKAVVMTPDEVTIMIAEIAELLREAGA